MERNASIYAPHLRDLGFEVCKSEPIHITRIEMTQVRCRPSDVTIRTRTNGEQTIVEDEKNFCWLAPRVVDLTKMGFEIVANA